MSEKWYVLHVHTGREVDIRGELRRLGYAASAPTQIITERRGGKWRERTRVVMPGYVFLRMTLTGKDYYAVRGVPGVIRFLGAGHPEPLPKEEEASVLWLDNGGLPLGLSDALPGEGRTVTILSGPLRGREGRIVRVNRRQRRAVLAIAIAGEPREVSMALNVIGRCGGGRA